MVSLTWRHPITDAVPSEPAEIRTTWDAMSRLLFEPLRSVFLAAGETGTLGCERLAQWPTVAWDNRQGRITLAGDAAHPMTYRQYAPLRDPTVSLMRTSPDRGQGLSHAIHDAAYLGRVIEEHLVGGKALSEVIEGYEKELVERGHEAVVSSGQNSLMLADWARLRESPMFKMGLTRDGSGCKKPLAI